MPKTPDEIVRLLTTYDKDHLLLALLHKREYDGLNGRWWNASKHLHWEEHVSQILDKYKTAKRCNFCHQPDIAHDPLCIYFRK